MKTADVYELLGQPSYKRYYVILMGVVKQYLVSYKAAIV